MIVAVLLNTVYRMLYVRTNIVVKHLDARMEYVDQIEPETGVHMVKGEDRKYPVWTLKEKDYETIYNFRNVCIFGIALILSGIAPKLSLVAIIFVTADFFTKIMQKRAFDGKNGLFDYNPKDKFLNVKWKDVWRLRKGIMRSGTNAAITMENLTFYAT